MFTKRRDSPLFIRALPPQVSAAGFYLDEVVNLFYACRVFGDSFRPSLGPFVINRPGQGDLSLEGFNAR